MQYGKHAREKKKNYPNQHGLSLPQITHINCHQSTKYNTKLQKNVSSSYDITLYMKNNVLYIKEEKKLFYLKKY